MAERLGSRLRAGPEVALGWLGAAGFVVLVYVTVVRGGAVLIDDGGPPVLLSILATVLVAATIDPVQRRCERAAARLLRGGEQSPYEVLTQFSSQVSAAEAAGRLPQLMARQLAEGTGAAWAQVWLLVNGHPRLMATHPPDAAADSAGPGVGGASDDGRGLRTVTVGHGGAALGVLRLQERPGHRLTTVEERLFAGLASQAGLALHGAQLRAELAARHLELTRRAGQLRQARAQLVAAHDQERQRLERDIHDGAQQQLVALRINLRLAQTLAERSPERARRVLGEQGSAAEAAIETLSVLSRGVRPPILDREGLPAALAAASASCPLPVDLALAEVGRFPRSVESAVYFAALEALQNAVKHAGATRVGLSLIADGDLLQVTVRDDGRGIGGGAEAGAGLANMTERLRAVGGTLRIDSTSGVGTSVVAAVPAVRVPAQRSE